MIKIEENLNTAFDFHDLEYRPGLPVQLCAFELIEKQSNDHKLVISNKLKNIASVNNSCVNSTMDNFKYHVKFDGIIVQARVAFDDDKYLAVASIDQLKSFLPQKVDLDVNKDLMGVAFDAFVVNRGNKNGHIIGTDVALAMVENFVNKPFNIEHNRKTVVGFCTGYGFSEFGSSKPLTLDDVKGMTEPFNVVLSGYVWKVVNPDFAEELVKSNDPSSTDYLSVSASWELGFNEFNIAKGSKNLNEATIVDDENEIKSLQDDLKVFGGTGYDNNSLPIFLNLQGNVLPLGIGFTNTPAAEVQGVKISTDSDSKILQKDMPSNADDMQEDSATNQEKQEKEDNKSVLSSIENVKNIMQINTVEDITDDSMKEIAASAVRDFIKNSIEEMSKEWSSKVEEKENALKNSQEELSTLKAEIENIKAESEKVKTEFSVLQEAIKAQEIEATFQRRMSLIDDEYNLTDADHEIIAEDLRSIDSDEAFEKWMKKFSVLADAKKKSNQKATTNLVQTEKPSEQGLTKDQKNIGKYNPKTDSSASINNITASEEVVEEQKSVEDVISQAPVEEPEIPNTAPAQELSLNEKISAAFNKNSVRINTR